MKQLIILAAVCVLAVPAMAEDFFLYNNMQLTVSSHYSQGAVLDTSRVFIIPGGVVEHLNSYGFSAVDVSGGNVVYLNAYGFSAVDVSGGSLAQLYAWNSSTVNVSNGDNLILARLEVGDSSTANISAGSFNTFYAYGQSIINLSGGHVSSYLRGYGFSAINISSGHVDTPVPHDYSTVNMSGGSARWFSAEGFSTTHFSGGSTEWLYATDSSIVNISGGSIESLHVRDTSTINIFGQNFQYGSDLILDGNRLLGTGVLSGQWSDGTPWEIDVAENYSTATIHIIPEPATVLLLGLGGLAVFKRKSVL